MLAAAALRLAAIEALCPHAVVSADTGLPDHVGYPTLARNRVFDSRAAGLQDLDRNKNFTPVLALYSPENGRQLRGPLTDASDVECDAMLDIVAELAVHDVDIGSEGQPEEFAAAMAGDDPEARLVLEALVSQCTYVLEHSHSAGAALFRRICKRVVKADSVTFGVPQLGLRFHRVTTRLHCEVRTEDFDVPAGDLPEPIRSVFNQLPAGSYAKAKLAALAAHFSPDQLPALDGVQVTTGPITSGI